MNRSTDLLSVLKEDHRELKQLYTELEHLCGGERLRRVLTDQLIVEAVRHSVAEECYLYPVARACLPNGDRLVEEALADHDRLEGILRRLESSDLPDDQFALLLSWLITSARQHIDDEEERIFPLVAEHVSREELIALGENAWRFKTEAPSRSSRTAHDRPLSNLLLKSGSGLVERVREYLRGQGKAYSDTR
jgi:hemerythrin-like domain-containing protein